jgi:A/G-specific adenine glycosylase
LRAVPVRLPFDPTPMRAALLRWYQPRAGLYPWRRAPSPYRTLVSEVMLQQTQASRVAPAFDRFVERFPDVRVLAAAPRSEVLRTWADLGYNRRAVALSEAARTIVRQYGGVVPRELSALQALSGVGPYTAAAVASIGYGEPVAAVDVNVRRVVARVAFGDAATTPARVRDAAGALLDVERPAAWNQAVMDLGREACRPSPRCEVCPVARWCRWRARNPAGASSEPRRGAGRGAQERFEGSFRQIRGGVLRVLRDGPATASSISTVLTKDVVDVRRAIAMLATEGAIEMRDDDLVVLAEDD